MCVCAFFLSLLLLVVMVVATWFQRSALFYNYHLFALVCFRYIYPNCLSFCCCCSSCCYGCEIRCILCYLSHSKTHTLYVTDYISFYRPECSIGFFQLFTCQSFSLSLSLSQSFSISLIYSTCSLSLSCLYSSPFSESIFYGPCMSAHIFYSHIHFNFH